MQVRVEVVGKNLDRVAHVLNRGVDLSFIGKLDSQRKRLLGCGGNRLAESVYDARLWRRFLTDRA